MREMRMPWPSSTRSKPRSTISRNISAPSVCRPEFQQVENAITLNGRGGRRRGRFEFCLADSDLGALLANTHQNEKRDHAIADRRDLQSSRHSDEIGETRHAQSGQRHEADEAEHEHS